MLIRYLKEDDDVLNCIEMLTGVAIRRIASAENEKIVKALKGFFNKS